MGWWMRCGWRGDLSSIDVVLGSGSAMIVVNFPCVSRHLWEWWWILIVDIYEGLGVLLSFHRDEMRTRELNQDGIRDPWPAIMGLEVIHDVGEHLAGADIARVSARVKSRAGVTKEAGHGCG